MLRIDVRRETGIGVDEVGERYLEFDYRVLQLLQNGSRQRKTVIMAFVKFALALQSKRLDLGLGDQC